VVIPVVLLAALAALAATAIRIVKEGERILVFRLGRFHRVLHPGLRSALPGLDRTVRVRLDITVPGWRELSEPELDARIRELASTGQLAMTRST
jgi:regulator of protease activity HflC (stomatin/prohibitin superfamily)